LDFSILLRELSTNIFKLVTQEHTFDICNWNCAFDIGLLYSENLSQAVYVAFDSENSFDNFEETFGTNFNTMPSFS
jgi:hypothetical protein